MLPSSVTDQLKLSVDTVYVKPSSRSFGSGGCQAASWGMLQNHHGENRQLERAHLEPRANNLLLQFCGNRKAFSSQGSLQLPPKPKPKTALTALHYDNSQQFQQHQEKECQSCRVSGWDNKHLLWGKAGGWLGESLFTEG